MLVRMMFINLRKEYYLNELRQTEQKAALVAASSAAEKEFARAEGAQDKAQAASVLAAANAAHAKEIQKRLKKRQKKREKAMRKERIADGEFF